MLNSGLKQLDDAWDTEECADEDLVAGNANARAILEEYPGRYTDRREFAVGGMGRILIAHDEQLGRDVVIKELLGDKKTDSEKPPPRGLLRGSTPVAARFVREARIAGQLEHPAIIPVHELGFRENGDLYYTMKYVQGVSLSEALEKAAGLDERLGLLPHVLDVCQAIAYAHSRGVIHRDIKPGNVMVGEFGETVVLDWGLARVKGVPEETEDVPSANNGGIDVGGVEGNAKTACGEVLGTPGYMAPEQARGLGNQVDARTDVYALGALLYTLLTGKPPFSGDKRDDIIRKAAAGVPEPVRTLETRAAPELAAICEKAMAPDPARRYSSAKELAEELQRYLTGGLVAAHEYRWAEHLYRFMRRYKNILVTVGLATAILIAVAIGSYLRVLRERDAAVQAQNEALREKDNATRARDEAVQARERTDQQLCSTSIAFAQAAVETGRPRHAKRAILSAPEKYRHWEWGLMAALSHPDVLILRNPAGSVHRPWFSPDGRWIASTDEEGGEVQVWDATTGKLVRRLHWGDTGWGWPRFSPDSRLVAAGFDDGWLSLWEVETGRRVLRIRADETKIGAVEFDPSGQTIAAAGTRGTCTLWDVDTGQKRLALEGTGYDGSWQNVAFSRDGQRFATSSGDTASRVWDTSSGRELMRLEGHEGDVCGVAFSPDGRWIATGAMDRAARLWDAETGALVRILEGHTDEVVTVLFSPDSQRLFVGSRDGTVSIWNVADGQREQVLEGCASGVGIFHVDFTTQRLVTYVSVGGARVGVVRSLEPLHDVVVLRGHTGRVNAIAFSPDSRLVATGAGNNSVGDDTRAIVWEAATGRQLTVLEGHRGPVNGVAFLANGELILTASWDKTAVLWEVRSGKRLRTYVCNCRIRALAVTPDEKTFMTGGWEDVGHVGVWEVDTGCQVALLDASPNNRIDGLAIDPKGSYLASTGDEESVVVWDIASLQEVTRLKYSGGSAYRQIATFARFSPDARTLALKDGAAIRLWDTQAWKCIGLYEGHTNSVLALSYYPQGGRLASAGVDGTVRLWDTVTGRETLLLNCRGPVAFSPDGQTLATGDGTTVVLWHAFPWRVEDYPGDSGMALEDRIQLARMAREQEVAERERFVDAWQKEAEERETCHARLVELDTAKLAWAEAKGGTFEDTPASLSDLQPYLADSDAPLTCPSSGTYQLGAVQDLPRCSAHGAPEENPALMERFKNLRDHDQLAFKVILARLRDRSSGIQPIIAWLDAAQDENDSAFQAVMASLSSARWVDADDLNSLAWRWATEEHRFYRSAVRLAQKAAELRPRAAYIWDTLAYSEVGAGDVDNAVEHFRKLNESYYEWAKPGLPLALVTRGRPEDLVEALPLLEGYAASNSGHMYVRQALETLRNAPPPKDPVLRARIEKLLSPTDKPIEQPNTP